MVASIAAGAGQNIGATAQIHTGATREFTTPGA
jgi:hypothetical protein